MNAAEYLLERGDPDRTALITETETVSFAQLRTRVGGVVRALAGLGLGRGDRIAIIGDNSLEWVAAYLGALAAGAVAVPLAPTLRAEQLGELVRATGCRAFVVQERYRARFAAALPPGAKLLRADVADPAGPDGPSAADHVAAVAGVPVDDRRELASLMYTSGSTGAPRAVMVSHRNIIANTEDIVGYLELDERDRIMVVLPFHYCFGTSLLHTHLRAGASLVINNRFAFPQLVLDQIERTGCTGLAGVPSTYQILLRSSNLKQRALPALTKLQQAGGKLPNVFLSELRAALPHARLYVMYGQTEATARLSYLPPGELDRRLGSIGKGMPGVELRVARPDGTPVAAGEVGEIVARGDNVTRGYLDDAEQTAQTFRDGALWTGDLARVDEDGFIFVVDRAKDFIKASGHRVAAKEIEDALVALPEVVEAAVVGVPDDVLGEAPKAFVVLRRGAALTAEDLVRHCRRLLPAYMVPRDVALVGSLPRSASGKVAKSELRTPPGS
jgi:long-chain acyl-CoA synthetase